MKIAHVTFNAVIALVIISCAAYSEDYTYESRGRRDPFVPLVGLEKPGFVRLEDAQSVDDLILEGIASEASGKKIAIINGRLMKEEERIGTIEIKKITDNTVTLSMNGQPYTIKLPERGAGRRE